MHRLLFFGGDVSTPLPADLWLEELITSSLTESGEGDLSNLQERNHIVITKTVTKKEEMPPVGLEENSCYFCLISSSLG